MSFFAQRRTALIGLLLAALFVMAACTDDLGPRGGWSGIVEDDQFLYLGNRDGRVVRISKDSFTLDQTWQFPPTDDYGEIYTEPVLADGIAYGGGYNCVGNTCSGDVFAFDLESGAPAWAGGSFEIKTKLIGPLGVGESVLAVGTSAIDEKGAKGNLIGLSLDENATREQWRLPLDGAVWGGVTVVENIAYFGTMGGMFYAVDLAEKTEYESDVSDRIIWSFETDGAIAGQPVVANGKVYFGSFNENVYSLDINFRTSNPDQLSLDSASEWAFETGDWVWATPLLVEDTMYVSNIRGLLFALDISNGGERWASPAQVGQEIVSQPTLFEGSTGTSLAVASGEGGISVVLVDNGLVSGEFATNGKGVKSSPLVIDDSLYAHSDNGQVWRFSTDTLAVSGCIEAKGEGKRCG